MRGEIIGILIIAAILAGVEFVKMLISKSNFSRLKNCIKRIEDAEIEARFGGNNE